MESLHANFSAHCDHEPALRCLPLPEGEGWGEGEQSVRITKVFRPDQWLMESHNVFLTRIRTMNQPESSPENCRRCLPLPKGEGWGEGEQSVQITKVVHPNQWSTERC